MRTRIPWFLAAAVLAPACIGLDTMKKDEDPGHNLDTAETGFETGRPLDSAVDGNTAPLADAGDDGVGTVGRVADLDGSGSSDPDHDALTYAWELTEAPAGSAVDLINADRVNAELVPDVAGRYVATLTVSDGALEDADEVAITVTGANGDPVADAGPDQVVTPGATVALDGSGSADPEGDPLAYIWTLASRPGGSTAVLVDATTATPSFVADIAGDYEVSLTVSDGTTYSAADTVRVRASDPSSGGSSSSCGCTAAPDALGGSVLAGVFFGLPALLRRRRARG